MRSKDDFNRFAFEIDNLDGFIGSVVADFDSLSFGLLLSGNGEDSVSSFDGRGNNLDELNSVPVRRNLKPLIGISKNILDFGVADSNLLNLVGFNDSHTVFSLSLSNIVRFGDRFNRADCDNLRFLFLRVNNYNHFFLGFFSLHDDCVLSNSFADFLDFGCFRDHIGPSGVMVLDNSDDIFEDGVSFNDDGDCHLRDGGHWTRSRFDSSVEGFSLRGGCGAGFNGLAGDDFDVLGFFLVNHSGSNCVLRSGTSKDNSHTFSGSVVSFHNRVNIPRTHLLILSLDFLDNHLKFFSGFDVSDIVGLDDSVTIGIDFLNYNRFVGKSNNNFSGFFLDGSDSHDFLSASVINHDNFVGFSVADDFSGVGNIVRSSLSDNFHDLIDSDLIFSDSADDFLDFRLSVLTFRNENLRNINYLNHVFNSFFRRFDIINGDDIALFIGTNSHSDLTGFALIGDLEYIAKIAFNQSDLGDGEIFECGVFFGNSFNNSLSVAVDLYDFFDAVCGGNNSTVNGALVNLDGSGNNDGTDLNDIDIFGLLIVLNYSNESLISNFIVEVDDLSAFEVLNSGAFGNFVLENFVLFNKNSLTFLKRYILDDDERIKVSRNGVLSDDGIDH